MSGSDPRDVMLVDLGSIFWSAWHATANAQISEARDRSLSMIRRLTAGYDLVAVCCDSDRNWRKELEPSYKANRPPRDSAAYEELGRTKHTLAADGLLLWESDGFEADDVLATACRAAVGHDHRVIVVSSDKDLTQLVQLDVTWLSPKTGEHLDREGVRQKFGVYPEQMRDYLALTGDRTDNVRGVKGVGEKGAVKLLTEYVTLEQLMTAVVKTPHKVATPNICGALRDALVWLPTTARLVSLRYDVPLNWDEIYERREPKPMEQPMNDTEVVDSEFAEIDEPAQPEPAQPEPSQVIPIRPEPVKAQAIEIAETPAIVAAPSWELGLEPTSLGAAFKLAKGLHESGLYSKFKNPAAIWAVIIRGRELGLGALTALDCFHVIEGKPAPSAHFLIAKAKAHRDCEYLEFVEGDHKFALWKGKAKGGKEIPLRYTIEEAEKAGLLFTAPGKQPGNWHKRPAEMLRKTAGVQLARIIVPGALQGLYGAEELGAA